MKKFSFARYAGPLNDILYYALQLGLITESTYWHLYREHHNYILAHRGTFRR